FSDTSLKYPGVAFFDHSFSGGFEFDGYAVH
ncbi:MAG: hypothetical protein ACI8VT_003781, partial [Saprospiraceae bacterium]